VLVDGRRFLVVGHRGAAARAPENTAASLGAGLDAGADLIEIDVGLTRDGRAVLLHDTTLDRTTSGRGPLRGATWDRVSLLDAGSWFSRRFRGEPPIDLDDALAIVRARVPLIVEVKPVSRERGRAVAAADRATVDAVIAAFERTGGLRGVTMSSAGWTLLEHAASRASGLDLALTMGFSERRDPFEWARRVEARALHPNARRCSREFFSRARDSGLLVIPYTVNAPSSAASLLEAGAGGVFTDDPAAMRRGLSRRGAKGAEQGELALGIDQGSGGTRSVLLDAAGSIVASRAVKVASRRGAGGAIVQDAEAIAASVVRASLPLIEIAPRRIAAAGLAVQRSSLVVWRRSDLKPVAPVLSWRAATAYEPPEALLRIEERIHRATGLTALYPYGAIRLAALAARVPEIDRGLRNGRLLAGPLGAFLAARLATRATAPCDPSLAQRTLAFDLDHGAFDTGLCDAAGVPAGCWPAVAPSTADRGLLRLGRARIPFRALLGDVGAAARSALGPLDSARDGALVLGTGGFVVVPTGRIRCHVEGLLTTLLYEDGDGPVFAIEGTVHGLASGLVAAGRHGGWEELPAPRIGARAGGARRFPSVVAATEGTGTPDWEVVPRFTVEPGRWSPEEIVAGTIEDLAARFGVVAGLLRARDVLPTRFVASGGIAFAPHLTARISSRMGVSVEVDPRPDRTAAGAALLARDAV
jgi:glycerophosphoryl diester phosphodiesterase